MPRYHTPLITAACKCGGRGIAKGGWDSAENMDTVWIECDKCPSRTNWPHAERHDAIKEWNRIQEVKETAR